MSTCYPHACRRPASRPFAIIRRFMSVFGLVSSVGEEQAAQRTTRHPPGGNGPYATSPPRSEREAPTRR